jgi:hypothetical protein
VYKIFWSENLKERDHSEDLVVDGRILLEWIMEIVWEGVDWMRDVTDTELNLRVPLR